MKKGLLKALLYATLTAFSILLFVIILLQMPFAKNTMRAIAENQISKKSKQEVHIARVSGFLPFIITFHDIELGNPLKPFATIPTATVSLTFWSLFTNSSLIASCNIAECNILDTPPPSPPSKEKKNAFLAWPISPVSRLAITAHIDRLYISDSITHTTSKSYSITTALFMQRASKNFSLDYNMVNLTQKEQSLNAQIKGIYSMQNITCHIQAKDAFLEELCKLIGLSSLPHYTLKGSLEGSYRAIQRAFMPNLPQINAPIIADISLDADNRELPQGNIWRDFFGKNDWSFKTAFKWFIGSNSYFSDITIKSHNLSLEANGIIDTSYQLDAMHITASCERLEDIAEHIDVELVGSLGLQATLYGNPLQPTGKLKLKSQYIEFGSLPIDNFSGSIIAEKSGDNLTGEVIAKGTFRNIPIFLTSPFIIYPNYELSLKNLMGKIQNGNISGYLDLATSHPLLHGSITYVNENMSALSRAFQHNLNGKLQFTLDMDYMENSSRYAQKFDLSLSGTHITYDSFWFKTLNASMHFETIWKRFYRNLVGSATISGEDYKYDNLKLDTFTLTGSMGDGKLPFTIQGKGKLKGDLSIDASGVYTILDSGYSIQMNHLFGVLLEESITLQHPFVFNYHPNWIKLDPIELDVGSGSCELALDVNNTDGNLFAKMRSFPLDVFTLFTPHIDVLGIADLDLSITQHGTNSVGSLEIKLQDFKVADTDIKDPPLQGKILANLENKRLKGSISLSSKKNHRLAFTYSLPIELDLKPFTVDLIDTAELSAFLTYKGFLDSSIQLLLPHNHYLSGKVLLDLHVNGTVKDPNLTGSLSLKEGFYENIYTGLILKNMQFDVVGENNKLVLKNFQATDGKKGEVNADGTLTLNVREKFPFDVHFHLKHIDLLKLDYLSAQFNGNLNLYGNIENAYASGDISVTKADFTIPDTTKEVIPNLNVIYINPIPQSHYNHTATTALHLPINFNVHLDVPGHALLQGRGLNSTWKGSLDITGSDINPQVMGEVTLVAGKFFFAGKTLNLTEGRVSFNGNPQTNTFIYLSSETDVQDTKIYAILNGPVDAPTLTFQSDPALSQSAILALLLYDKDIEDLSPFQAIALARTAASLSGTYAGPDVVDKLRRNAGLDQLSFSTEESSVQKVNIQFGKYITRDILVTLNSGLTYAPSEVDVAAHFKYGWQLQARVGYLTISQLLLLWKYNY